MADYLKYWSWREVNAQLERWTLLVHDNSNQFKRSRVGVGDTIWYVTIQRSDGVARGQLKLFGRLQVGTVWDADHVGVQRYLEQRYQIHWHARDEAENRDTVSEATYHLTPIEGTAERVDLDSDPIPADQLRFVSSNNDRLTVDDHGLVVSAMQLETLRILTTESAELLAERWNTRSKTPEPPEDLWPEGKEAWVAHRARERNRELIRVAKARFIATHGRLFCQVCEFDFAEHYGAHGEGYIEAHHTLPVSEMPQDHKTRVEDLAMVCSNCHRMLHYRRPWLRMHELRELLTTSRVSVRPDTLTSH